jgi:hypothetical protein
MPPDNYGPWSPACDQVERGKQLRTLSAIVHLQLGPNHPLITELRAAETSLEALGRAQERVETLPSLPAPPACVLHRRHLAAEKARCAMSRPDDRSVRRQYLVGQLHACGPRVVMEALIQVAASSPAQLDSILESFCSLPPEVYRSIGADVLPINRLVNGGRR